MNRPKRAPRVALPCAIPFLVLSCDPRERQPSSDEDARVASLVRLVERAAARPAERKLSEGLRARLAASLPNDRFSVLVDLTDQLDLKRAGSWLDRHGIGRVERRRLVVSALQALAGESQRGLRPFLDRLRRQGEVTSYRGFAIINRLHVVATARAIRAVAGRRDVAAIVEELEKDLPEEGEMQATARRTAWAIAALGVDVAWRRGLDGRGIVVGIIDPGASAAHEQLRGNFRGGPLSWHDPTGRHAAPHDVAPGHGTGVLSAAVGQNVGGITLGVAPGAQWIACAGLPRRRVNNVLVTACADWMLTTGQPDVVIIPWLIPGRGCDTSLHRVVSAWRAVEIFPVFAAGNHGPDPSTDRSPANYTGLYPGDGVAFAVGGTTPDGDAYREGSRGPGSCGGSTYPLVVAPAVDVPAALPLAASAYAQAAGTSFAAGYAAGAAAILLQRFPEALVIDLEAALVASAVDAGQPGPDNTFGYGRLYVPAALRELERRLARQAKASSAADVSTQR